ncbi:MAG: DUF362 domain-containing protein [Acidobacteria bacterium]|nr:MAG: DUF362 domain-containing protein [Acidobacteriota bacterium]
MNVHANRREFIQGFGAALAGLALAPRHTFGAATPAPPVAVAKCMEYGPGVRPTLSTLFDQLGGLSRIVRGKTVAVKINMTGHTTDRVQGMPIGMTHWVHPEVIGNAVHLLGQAGARRIILVESSLSPSRSLQQFMSDAGWNPHDFASAAPRVDFVDSNYGDPGGTYKRLWVPGGGLMFRAYDLNPVYTDCDVYVSLAKLKEHATAGVTLSMKNSFGITPCTIYGHGAGIDKPSDVVKGSRGMLHEGDRQPSRTALSENDPNSPRQPGYRVPRVTADLVHARPIHLAVIDGIHTVAGGEGPWIKRCRPVHAGVLVAGTNPVTTDAVATALMGFDPMAARGTAPFEGCDSTLKLAEDLGIGTRDLNRIEVIGTPISKARIDFRNA